MAKGLHPLVMIALVGAVTLFGRVLPTWTLSLATIASANALMSRSAKACSLPPAAMALH
jgi:branched-chain amino acid transport system permease protein